MAEADEGPDLEEVRAYMIRKGHRHPDDPWPVSPPEVRFYLLDKPLDDATRERRERERRKSEETWAEAARLREAAAEYREHKRKAREWGRQAGLFVGTRGRIPDAVWQGYQESIGRKL
jgi:hypothetical protein